jgi:hypothetical protein
MLKLKTKERAWLRLSDVAADETALAVLQANGGSWSRSTSCLAFTTPSVGPVQVEVSAVAGGSCVVSFHPAHQPAGAVFDFLVEVEEDEEESAAKAEAARAMTAEQQRVAEAEALRREEEAGKRAEAEDRQKASDEEARAAREGESRAHLAAQGVLAHQRAAQTWAASRAEWEASKAARTAPPQEQSGAPAPAEFEVVVDSEDAGGGPPAPPDAATAATETAAPAAETVGHEEAKAEGETTETAAETTAPDAGTQAAGGEAHDPPLSTESNN